MYRTTCNEVALFIATSVVKNKKCRKRQAIQDE